MKLTEFRKLIREEVRKVVNEEVKWKNFDSLGGQGGSFVGKVGSTSIWALEGSEGSEMYYALENGSNIQSVTVNLPRSKASAENVMLKAKNPDNGKKMQLDPRVAELIAKDIKTNAA